MNKYKEWKSHFIPYILVVYFNRWFLLISLYFLLRFVADENMLVTLSIPYKRKKSFPLLRQDQTRIK